MYYIFGNARYYLKSISVDNILYTVQMTWYDTKQYFPEIGASCASTELWDRPVSPCNQIQVVLVYRSLIWSRIQRYAIYWQNNLQIYTTNIDIRLGLVRKFLKSAIIKCVFRKIHVLDHSASGWYCPRAIFLSSGLTKCIVPSYPCNNCIVFINVRLYQICAWNDFGTYSPV